MERSAGRRRRFWSDSEKRSFLSRHAESGKSAVVFCRDEGLALSSFQTWKKKFAEKPAFVEVVAPLQTHSVPVEIILASGSKVATISDCDPSWLAQFVRLLETVPC